MLLFEVLCFCLHLAIPVLAYSLRGVHTEHIIGLFLELWKAFFEQAPPTFVDALHTSATALSFCIISKCLIMYLFLYYSINSLRPVSVDYLFLPYLAHGEYPNILGLFHKLVNQINELSQK